MIGFLFRFPSLTQSSLADVPSQLDAIDSEAIVTEVLDQGRVWRVKYKRSWWNARTVEGTTLCVGDLVHVVDRHNLTLIVEPMPQPIDVLKAEIITHLLNGSIAA